MSTARVAEQIVGVGAMPDRHGWIRSDQTVHPGLARFRSTTIGDATLISIISTALTGTTADQYVGQLVMCVGPYTSPNFGLIRRITDFSPGTDQIFFDALVARTQVDDAWEGFDDGSSVFVESTGGLGATNVRDATRDEAVDFWGPTTGEHAIVVTSMGQTEPDARPVTAFTSPNLTVAPGFDNIPSVGALFDVMALPAWSEPPEFERSWGEVPVEAQRGGVEAFDEEPHLLRIPSWSGKCALHFKGSGTAAGNGTQGAYAAESYRMLSAIFDAVRSTGEAVVAGSTTAAVNITDGTLAQFPVGSPALHAASGRLAMAISTGAGTGAEDIVNLQPYLDRAPAAAEILYGGVAWYPKITGHQAVCFHEWDDAMRWHYYGGVPNVELANWGIGQKPTLRFAYQGGPFFGYRKAITLAPQLSSGVVRDTVRPNGLTHSRIILFSSSANLDLLCVNLSVNYQFDVQKQVFANLPMGFYAMLVVKVTPTFQVTCKVDRASPNDTMYEIERMLNEGQFAILAQGNQMPGHTIGWHAHQTQWTGPKFRASNGMREIEFTGKVKRSGVSGLGMCGLIQS